MERKELAEWLRALLPALVTWYQTDRVNWDQKTQNSEIHIKETNQSIDIFRRDVQLSKQQLLMGTAADIELTLAQMHAALTAAMKEAERDQYDQRNQQLQTIIIAASLMMTALYTLLIQGIVPQATLIEYAGPYSEGFAIAFAATNGCSLCLLFISVVLCIETLRLASTYMVKRARNDLDTYKHRKRRMKNHHVGSGLKANNFARDTYYSASKLNAYARKVERASAKMPDGRSTARGGGAYPWHLLGATAGVLGSLGPARGGDPEQGEAEPDGDDAFETQRDVIERGQRADRRLNLQGQAQVQARREQLARAPSGPVRRAGAAGPTLEVGAKVEANYMGRGKWYAAKITRVHHDGTFDVEYGFGEKAQRVDKDLIRDDAYRSTEIMWGEIEQKCRDLATEFIDDLDGNESDNEEEPEGVYLPSGGWRNNDPLLNFETFWKNECLVYHECATLTFYGGTLSLLAATILWCFLQFRFSYASQTAAYVVITFLLAGVVTGIVLWLSVVRSGRAGIFKAGRGSGRTAGHEVEPGAECGGCSGGGGGGGVCVPCSTCGGGRQESGRGGSGPRAVGGVLPPPPPPPTPAPLMPRPLHYACEVGAPVHTVRLLLESQPADAVRETDLHGECALHIAVANNAPLEVVRVLLEAHPSAVRERNHARQLPIDIAYKKHPRNLQLQATIKAAEADKDENLPLHHVCRVPPLLIPACDDEIRKAYHPNSQIGSYLTAFPEAADVRGKGGNLPLHIVCSNVCPRASASSSSGSSSSGSTSSSSSSSSDAASQMEEMTLSLLSLQNGPDAAQRQASAKNLQGSQALHLACQHNAPLSVVKLLLAAHPKAARTKNAQGYLPIHYAVESRASVAVLQALTEAPSPLDVLLRSISSSRQSSRDRDVPVATPVPALA